MATVLAAGPRPVMVWRDFSCPPGYRERAVSISAVVMCEATDAIPPGAPTLPPERQYGSSAHEIGLYFANVRVRVFDFDLIAENYHWLASNVPPPP